MLANRYVTMMTFVDKTVVVISRETLFMIMRQLLGVGALA
jgi:hypothetical protein